MSFLDLHFKIVYLIKFNDGPISMPLAIKCSIKFWYLNWKLHILSHIMRKNTPEQLSHDERVQFSWVIVSVIPLSPPLVFPLSVPFDVFFSSFMNSSRAVRCVNVESEHLVSKRQIFFKCQFQAIAHDMSNIIFYIFSRPERVMLLLLLLLFFPLTPAVHQNHIPRVRKIIHIKIKCSNRKEWCESMPQQQHQRQPWKQNEKKDTDKWSRRKSKSSHVLHRLQRWCEMELFLCLSTPQGIAF